MGSFGWHNPWPFEWGGGPTADEAIYEAWRAALGDLPAEDDSGIDGLWRQCRAEIVATAASLAERAFLQAFPQTLTDHLALWEEYLFIVPGAATDEERRKAVGDAYTLTLGSNGPAVLRQLKAIDPRFLVEWISHALTTTTVLGNAFASQWPAYSGEALLPVTLATETAFPLDLDRAAMLRAKRMLNDALPAWQDFQIATRWAFWLDVSPLDWTMLTDV